MTTWHAGTAQGLAEIGGVIHDAWFDIDGVRHDEATQMLIVPFAQQGPWGPMLDDPTWRDAPKPTLLKRTWRYREERVPFMRGTLRVGAVESVAIDPDAGDAGMLLGIRFDAGKQTVIVETASGQLAARIHRLDVNADLVNEVARYVRRRYGLLGVSDALLPHSSV